MTPLVTEIKVARQASGIVSAVICFLLMLPLKTSHSAELVNLETRSNVSQSFLLLEPDTPIQAIVLMFPGGEGEIEFPKTPTSAGYSVGGNNLSFTSSENTRSTYLKNGFVVALIAPPSDQLSGMDTRFRSSNKHLRDVEKVIDYLADRYHKDVYLHGHCRSSFSPVSVATKLRNKGIAGIVLTSARSRGRHGSIIDYEEGVIAVPVLLVQHKYDACKGTPYRNLKKLERFFEASSSQVDTIVEPPRVLRRLQLLREWSHEQVEQVFT